MGADGCFFFTLKSQGAIAKLVGKPADLKKTFGGCGDLPQMDIEGGSVASLMRESLVSTVCACVKNLQHARATLRASYDDAPAQPTSLLTS